MLDENQEKVSTNKKQDENQPLQEVKNGRHLMMTFLISFITGIFTASMILFIYTSYMQKPPHFYSFDLTGVIKSKEIKIMNNPQKNMKAEISTYMNAVGNYINMYSKNGIVLVSGASIGKSPYVTDITKGFKKYLSETVKNK